MGNTLFTARQTASSSDTLVFFGAVNIGSSTQTRVMNPSGFSGPAVRNRLLQTPFALPGGRLKSITVRHNTIGGGITPITYVLLKNGVATNLTVSLLPTETNATFSGGTDSVFFGSLLSVEVRKVNSTAKDVIDVTVSIGIC